MELGELKAWRIKRLDDAVTKVTGGNVTAFGKKVGFRDGAYIRQMLAGKRPITEKFILKLEAMRGLSGWFAMDGVPTELEDKVRTELAAREVPDQVLTGVLEMLRGFPVKPTPEPSPDPRERSDIGSVLNLERSDIPPDELAQKVTEKDHAKRK